MSCINGTYGHTLIIECVTSRALPPVATDYRGEAVVTATVTALTLRNIRGHYVTEMWVHTGSRRDGVFLKDFQVFFPQYNPINPAEIPPCATPSAEGLKGIFKDALYISTLIDISDISDMNL